MVNAKPDKGPTAKTMNPIVEVGKMAANNIKGAAQGMKQVGKKAANKADDVIEVVKSKITPSKKEERPGEPPRRIFRCGTAAILR